MNRVLGPFVYGRLQNPQTSEVTFAHVMTLLIEHSHILFFRYISLARTRYGEIIEQHEAITSALGRIYKENELAAKLHKQLEHEKIVLEERIAVSGVFNQ